MSAPQPPLTLDRAYWVVPGKLLAGSYPGDVNPAGTDRRLRALLDTGVSRVINLTFPGESFWDGAPCPEYAPALESLAREAGRTMQCDRLPIRDHDVPTVEHMREILDTIDRAHAAGDVVYVHCLAGKGRTGTVVGCWLARQGRAVGDAALWELNELVDHRPTSYGGIPQTRAQCQFVRQWVQGQ